MQKLLKQNYNLDFVCAEKSTVGAGSDTYFVTCTDGKYVVKYPASSDINHPDAEPQLCEYLRARGIPACQFLRNRQGEFLSTDESGRQFHVQRFLEGRMYDLNAAPDWLLTASARMLGQIHTALGDYPGLPEGIGGGFFQYMTPERALGSYRHSLAIAEGRGEARIAEDLRWRMDLMKRLKPYRFTPERLTLCATHGDFFISQLLCGDGEINAVIDWTTACVHPVVWELFRSFVYGAPSCADGQIDMEELAGYVAAYREFAPLKPGDLEDMVPLFFYQIAVCDYYGQYYGSHADNRHIYLHQAQFSTKLLRFLEENGEALARRLLK